MLLGGQGLGACLHASRHARPPVCTLQAPLAFPAVRAGSKCCPIDPTVLLAAAGCCSCGGTDRIVVATLVLKPRYPRQCMLPTSAPPCLLYICRTLRPSSRSGSRGGGGKVDSASSLDQGSGAGSQAHVSAAAVAEQLGKVSLAE